MKLSTGFLIIGAAALIALAGCAQAESSGGTKNNAGSSTTPRKLFVDLPATLTPQSNESSESPATGLSRAVSSGLDGAASAGYQYLAQAVGMVKNMAASVAKMSIMTEAVISQNNLSPGPDTHSGVTVTITSSMLEVMIDSLPEGLRDLEGLPAVGDQVPVPDFVYNTSDNTNFDYSMTFTLSMSMPDEPEAAGDSDTDMTITQTVYWNSAWTHSGMYIDMMGTTLYLANDSEDNSSYFSIGGDSLSYTVRFYKDAESSDNGVFVSVGMSMGGFSSLGHGYGDDNGGAITFDYKVSADTTMSYTEVFNADAQLTYQTNGTEEGTFGEDSDAYDAELENTEYGNASAFFM